jgi:hypothetical protein
VIAAINTFPIINPPIMPKYAKNQSVGFKNAIERVAIVGVSKPFNNTTYIAKLTNTLRLEVQLDRISPTPF